MATVTDTLSRKTELEAPSDFEPDGLYEFVDGQFVEKTVGAFEIGLAHRLWLMLGAYVRENQLGTVWIEMVFRLKNSPRLDRRPDIAFVSSERWPLEKLPPRTATWELVPDLAVEVVSPGNRARDDQRKLDEYFRSGSRGVWLIYPDAEKIYVYNDPTTVTILTRGNILDASHVIPGFTLDVAAFFGEPAVAEGRADV